MDAKIALCIFLLLVLSSCMGGKAKFTNVNNDPGETMMRAHYDTKTGLCSAGSIQFLSKLQIDELNTDWAGPENYDDCEEAQKLYVPSRTNYPASLAAQKISGAAHLLIRIDSDGSIESIHPMCATDKAFALAAKESVRAVKFKPRVCGGKSQKTVVWVPFGYDI